MKKKNIIMILSLSAILIVFLINFNKIKFLFSMLDVYIAENNEEEDSENIPDNPFDQFSLDFEDEDQFSLDLEEEENVSSDKETEEAKDLDVAIKSEKDSVENKNTQTIKKDKKQSKGKSINDIAYKYKPKLESLQAEFFGSIDNLISQASNEYSSGAPTTKIASKYLEKGTELESSSDSKVNSILKDLENELLANGHKTELVEELRAYYKSYKKNKKSELLSKAKKYI